MTTHRYARYRYAAPLAIAGLSCGVLANTSGAGAQVVMAQNHAVAPSSTPQVGEFTTSVEPLPSYKGQEENDCDPTAKPGTVALQKLLDDTYGPRWSNIVRTCSGSGSSGHHAGRALDWRVDQNDATQVAQTGEILNWLTAPDADGNHLAMARRMGLMYIIWDNKVLKLYKKNPVWTEYSNCVTGAGKAAKKYDTYCHRDHVHFSLTWQGARAETSFYTHQGPKQPRQPQPSAAPSRPACARTYAGQAPDPAALDNLGFTAIEPARLLDTRNSIGGPSCVAAPGQAFDVQVAGHGGVPASGVAAAVLNVTATNVAADTWVSALPAGSARSETTGLNVSTNSTGAALMVVPLGAEGAVTVEAGVGAADLVVDVVGYFAAGSGDAFEPMTPTRVFDDTVPGKQWRTVPGRVPADATAFVGNLVGDQPARPSYLALSPEAGGVPSTSSVNPTPGRAVANRAFVGTTGGTAGLYAHTSQRSVLDVTGWFGPTGSSTYHPVVAHRMVDSRVHKNVSGPLAGGHPATVQVAGNAGVPGGATAAVVSLTMVGATEDTWLAAWPGGQPASGTSDVNAVAGAPQTNLAVVPLGDDGSMNLQIGSGSSDVVVDVLGYFSPTT